MRDLQQTHQMAQLIDLCGIDYSRYGKGEPGLFQADALISEESRDAFDVVFSSAINREEEGESGTKEEAAPSDSDAPRFAVIYHLLSLAHNARLRVRVYCPVDFPMLDSVTDIWPCADWYEREAFDLFGILFNNHPDLRRILTDYGFIGHPFRKDFPIFGHAEVRYDPEKKRVVYQPVSIPPREVVPRIQRGRMVEEADHGGDS